MYLLQVFLKTISKNLNYIFDSFIWINLICFQMELEPRLKNKIYVPKVFDRFTTRKVDFYYFFKEILYKQVYYYNFLAL